jgi:hypothetical protein
MLAMCSVSTITFTLSYIHLLPIILVHSKNTTAAVLMYDMLCNEMFVLVNATKDINSCSKPSVQTSLAAVIADTYGQAVIHKYTESQIEQSAVPAWLYCD